MFKENKYLFDMNIHELTTNFSQINFVNTNGMTNSFYY